MFSGEWREGASPSRSLRTGHETLASSGPHRSACGRGERPPVGKEPGGPLNDSVEPGPRLGGTVLQSLEFLHCPSNEVFVDAPCEEVQLGAVEGPVIVDPASDLRIDLLSEAGQVRPTG